MIQLIQLFGQGNKIGGIVADDLGHEGHGRVVFRQNILEMRRFGAGSLRGGDKGRNGGVEAVKVPVKGIAKDTIRKAPQRREI